MSQKLKTYISELRENTDKLKVLSLLTEKYSLTIDEDFVSSQERLLDLLERAINMAEWYAEGCEGTKFLERDNNGEEILLYEYIIDDGTRARQFLETDPSTLGEERGE